LDRPADDGMTLARGVPQRAGVAPHAKISLRTLAAPRATNARLCILPSRICALQQ